MPISDHLKIKPTVYGRYILLNKIAVGGMAEVFRAKSFGAEGFEKLIAIKRLYPHLCEDESFVRMFINEAKLAATLNHVNIAPIYDFGKRDGLYYIGMEYVRGCDLSDLIERCRQRKQQVPLGLAVWLLIEICNGLDYAHRKHDDLGNFLNLIHRDITPQNILLSYEGEVKITDFGIAKVQILGRDETTGGVLKGKFSYMSPEQVRGERMDHRSDIFSLGIVAWELLTCQKMFDGPNDYHILEKVREALFIPPRQINPSLPPELERILMRALTRFPQDRYPSVGELRLDLLRFLSGSHLFPSRAHLSAFVRKLFKEKLETGAREILAETNIARELHEQQLRESKDYIPENSLFPSSHHMVRPPVSPSVENKPVEILAGGPSNFALPSMGGPQKPATPPHSIAARHMPKVGFRPEDFPLENDEEEDEPTLPDVSKLEQESRPAPQLPAMPRAPLGPPMPPPGMPAPAGNPNMMADIEAALSPQADTPTLASRPENLAPRPAHIPIGPDVNEHDDDEIFVSSFSFRRYLSLIVGVGTFLLGVLIVIVLSMLLKKQTGLQPSPAPTTRQQVSTHRQAPPTARAAAKGWLMIESTPWGYVYINGKLGAVTPYKKQLPAGQYRVLVVFPRRGKNIKKQLLVTVRANQTTKKLISAR